MMKTKLLWMLLTFLSNQVKAQSSGGLEQYYYIGKNQATEVVPIAYYQSSKNWYTEARYNYEAMRTLSLYAGKTFSRDAAFSYSATPVAGGVFGLMNGGSLGLNVDMDYKNLIFSSQSQYTFSIQDRTENYIYSWSELVYQPTHWMYAGIAMQQTRIYRTNSHFNTGVLLGFTYRHVTVPVYVFSPANVQRYFVLGINWQWQYEGSRNKGRAPVLLANKKPGKK